MLDFTEVHQKDSAEERTLPWANKPLINQQPVRLSSWLVYQYGEQASPNLACMIPSIPDILLWFP